MQPGWEPPNTPALWGRMEEPVGDYQPQQQQGGGYNPGYIQPQQPQQPQYQSPPPPQGLIECNRDCIQPLIRIC